MVGDSVATNIVARGNRDFVAIQNVGLVNVFVKFDGSSVPLTTANGFKLEPGSVLFLNNDGTKQIFTRDIEAISESGDIELRIQGED